MFCYNIIKGRPKPSFYCELGASSIPNIERLRSSEPWPGANVGYGLKFTDPQFGITCDFLVKETGDQIAIRRDNNNWKIIQ